MEKEFIPYEQALALKELGFDEPCFAIYEPQEIGVMFRWVENQKVVSNKAIGYVIAPLYQQAFRWFRERYGIFSSIWHFETEQKFFIEFGFGIHKFEVANKEEAELECLKKLIEIVKNSKLC
jgi:hypothetical protein